MRNEYLRKPGTQSYPQGEVGRGLGHRMDRHQDVGLPLPEIKDENSTSVTEFTQQISAFDWKTGRVTTIAASVLTQRQLAGDLITAPVPTLVRGDGLAVYSEDSDINNAMQAALSTLRNFSTNGHPDSRFFNIGSALLYDPNGPQTLISILREYATELQPRQAATILKRADDIERRLLRDEFAADTAESEWDTLSTVEQILPSLDQRTLSSEESFGKTRQELAHKNAEAEVATLTSTIETPFSQIITKIETSLKSALDTKQRQLTVASEPEDIMRLTAEITAIQANLEHCEIFATEQVDYDTYDKVAERLTGEIQDSIAAQEKQYGLDEINIAETRLQAISSLKGQFGEAKKRKQNAWETLYGTPQKPGSGLIHEAAVIHRKKISEQQDERGIPLIDALAAERLGTVLERRATELSIDVNSIHNIIASIENEAWYDVVDGGLPIAQRKTDADLQQRVANRVQYMTDLFDQLKDINPSLDITKIGLTELIKRAYVTSGHDSVLDQTKAQIMKYLTPALSRTLDIDIRAKFDQIVEELGYEVTTEELTEAVEKRQENEFKRTLGDKIGTIMEYLQIPHEARAAFIEQEGENLQAVLAADFDIALRANDEHLNPEAVLLNIARAKFNNEPFSVQIVRCLRWCYPNRELEFTPHAGDFQTLSPEGLPSTRHESTEIEKLRRVYNGVAQPLLHQDIPVGDITLLCTEDFELTGPGYNLDKDDERCVAARSYVDDLRTRAASWGVTGDIPIIIKSFNQLIDQMGRDDYEAILAQVEAGYDNLFADPHANYLGYTGSSLERILDTEHEHRQPFVKWWDRQRTRDFTRHFTTKTIALGALIARQDMPHTLTVSGNKYAGRTFGLGQFVAPETPPLGLTFYKSVNDGTQSALYQKMSQVIN